MKKKKIKGNNKKAIAAAFAATCAFTGCMQAQAADYEVNTFDGENGFENAFANGEYSSDGGTTVSGLQAGDRIILQGDIVTERDDLNLAVNDITIDGQGHTLRPIDEWQAQALVIGNGSDPQTLTIKDLNVEGYMSSAIGSFDGGDVIKFAGTCIFKNSIETTQYGTVQILEGASLTASENTQVDNLINNGSLTVNDYGAPALDVNPGEIALEIENYSQSDSAILNLNSKKANIGINGTIGGNINVSENTALNITKGSIETSKTVNLKGKINVGKDASVKVSGNDFSWDNKITVNGGTLDTTGVTSTNANASIDATQGIVKLGGTNTLNNSNIALGVDTTLNGDNTIVSGSTVELGEGDSWDGSLTLDGGAFQLNSGVAQGADNTFKGNSGTLGVNGSTLNVGNDSYIKDDVNVTLKDNGTISINGGNVVLDGASGKDNLESGTISMTGGGLELSNVSGNENLNITASAGDLTLDNVTFANSKDSVGATTKVTVNGDVHVEAGRVILSSNDVLNSGEISIEKGDTGRITMTTVSTTDGVNVRVEGGRIDLSGATLANSKDLITADATVEITKKGVNVDAGSLELNNNDILTGGSISLGGDSAGTVKIDGAPKTEGGDNFGTNENVNINAEGGNVILVNNATLNNENDLIAKEAHVTIDNGMTLNKGTVNLDVTDKISGTITQNNGTLSISGVETNADKNIVSNDGVLNLENTTLGGGDSVSQDVTFNATNVNQTSGTVNINNGDSIKGEYSILGGTLNVTDFSTTAGVDETDKGSYITASGGDVTLNNATLNNAQDSIASGANVTIDGNAAINAGSLELNEGDTLTGGTISMGADSQGTVKIDGTSSTDVPFGTTENVNINAEGGNVILANNATLNNENDLIAKDAHVTIDNGMTMNNGNVTLNFSENADSDSLTGTLNHNGGTLNVEGLKTDANSNVISTNGEINLTDVTFANANDNIDAGAKVTLNGNTTISNGSVVLENAGGDVWNTDASITLNESGKLTLDGITQGGNLNAMGGELVSKNVDLTIGEGSQILDAAKVTLDGGKIDVTNGGNVELNGSNDTLNSGSIALNGGSLSVSNIETNENLKLEANNGSLILDGITFNNSYDLIKQEINTTVNGDITLNAGEINLGADDTLNKGTISMGEATGGTINLDSVETNAVNIVADKGNVNMNNVTLSGENTSITAGANVAITNGIKQTAGTLELDGSDTVSGEIQLEGGNLTLAEAFATSDSSNINATGGNLHLNSATLNSSSDNIAKNTNVIINNGVTINKGNVVLDGSDTLNAGEILLGGADANLTLDGVKTVADREVIQEDGSTVVEHGVNISANTGNLTLKGVELNNERDLIADGAKVTIDGNVAVNDGSLTLGPDDILTNGTISIGTTNADKGSLILTDVSTKAPTETDAGSVNLIVAGGKNVELNNVTLANDKDKIFDSASVTVKNGINIQAGEATFGSNDNIEGTISQSGGTVILNGLETDNTKNINSTGGNLTISGTVLDDGTVASTLLNGNDTISGDTNLTINGPMEIQNAEVTINNGDTWKDTMTLNGGTLNYENRKENATLVANSGNLNIGNGVDETVFTFTEGSSIEREVNVNLNSGVIISGADNIILDSDTDKLQSGSILLEKGSLTLDGPFSTENVSLKATGGDLTLNNVALENDEDDIKFAAHTTINGPVNITKGNVELDAEDTLLSSDAIVLNGESATLGVDGFSTADTKIDLEKGTLHIVNRGLTLNNEGDVLKKDIKTVIDGNLTINDGKVYLNEDDSWNDGVVSVDTKGQLQFENFTKSTSNTLKMDGDAQVEMLNSTVGISKAENISNGTITIDDTSKVTVGSGSFNLQNLNTSGTINTQNGAFQTHLANTMTIMNSPYITLDGNIIQTGGKSRFAVDIYARVRDIKQNSDVFKGENLVASGSTTRAQGDETAEITINDWSLNGNLTRKDAPIDRSYNFKIFDYQNIDPNIRFSAQDKEVFTPIGYYKLFGGEDGNYTLSLTRYNPQVFRGQVTTLAQYQNQLAVDDLVTSHVILHNETKLADIGSNRFASATPTLGPYQYGQEDGGVWMKSYADLERLSMSENLNVHNTAYGAIIGADLPLVNLRNGWKFIPTPYIGYNGAHQSFNGVSAYQYGGQAGFMGTFMKDNYISSHTVYGGGYYNQMRVDYVDDNAANWFWGTAHKFAYNWNIKDHVLFQPTYFMSYNMFGNQGFHSDFGDMGMRSGMLNGINIAPGLNLIYLRDTWSLYAGAQYMWNINEQVSGRAGNVDIPNLNMRHGYIQYGLGGTKNIKDTLTSYAQVMFRNGGRTGVAFQLGLEYYYGLKESQMLKHGFRRK